MGTILCFNCFLFVFVVRQQFQSNVNLSNLVAYLLDYCNSKKKKKYSNVLVVCDMLSKKKRKDMESANDFVEFLIKGLLLSSMSMSIVFYSMGGNPSENIVQNSSLFFIPVVSTAVFNRVLGSAVNRTVKYSYTFIVLGISGSVVLAIRNVLPSGIDGFWTVLFLFITTAVFSMINVPDDTRLIAWNVVFVFFFPKGNTLYIYNKQDARV